MELHSDAAVLDGLARDLDVGYEAFVRAHAGAVYTTALRLSGSPTEADDLAQETFVRAYGALKGFDTERTRTLQPRPWLLTITVNLWRNRLRRAARRPRETATDGHDVAEGWTLFVWALARYPDKRCGHEVLCNSFRNPAHTAKI